MAPHSASSVSRLMSAINRDLSNTLSNPLSLHSLMLCSFMLLRANATGPFIFS